MMKLQRPCFCGVAVFVVVLAVFFGSADNPVYMHAENNTSAVHYTCGKRLKKHTSINSPPSHREAPFTSQLNSHTGAG